MQDMTIRVHIKDPLDDLLQSFTFELQIGSHIIQGEFLISLYVFLQICLTITWEEDPFSP